MAAPHKQLSFVGAGSLWRSDLGREFPGFEDCRLNFDTTVQEIPYGDHYPSTFDIPMGTKASLTISHNQFDALLLATMLGASTTDSLGLERVAAEAITVPAAPGPYTVTLAQSTVKRNYDDTRAFVEVIVKASDGSTRRYEQVAAAAEAQYKYSVALQVLTFDSTDAEVTGIANYVRSTTTGTKISLNPESTPAQFEFIGTMRLAASSGDNDLQYAVHCLNVVPKFPTQLGSSRGSHNPLTIDCSVIYDDTADIELYVP